MYLRFAHIHGSTQTIGHSNHHVIHTAAIASAFPGEPDLPVLVVPVTNPKLPGDFQCNSAMAIAKSLKGKPNAPVSPRDAALRIQAHLPSSVAIGSVKYAVAL